MGSRAFPSFTVTMLSTHLSWDRTKIEFTPELTLLPTSLCIQGTILQNLCQIQHDSTTSHTFTSPLLPFFHHSDHSLVCSSVHTHHFLSPASSHAPGEDATPVLSPLLIPPSRKPNKLLQMSPESECLRMTNLLPDSHQGSKQAPMKNEYISWSKFRCSSHGEI